GGDGGDRGAGSAAGFGAGGGGDGGVWLRGGGGDRVGGLSRVPRRAPGSDPGAPLRIAGPPGIRQARRRWPPLLVLLGRPPLRTAADQEESGALFCAARQ